MATVNQSDFPISIEEYKGLTFDISHNELESREVEQLKKNIEIVRDIIVFITGNAAGKGLGGHTGGAFDIVPEYLIMEALMKGGDKVHPKFFDEAGHRVAIHYVMKALNGAYGDDGLMKLLHYREHASGLPGHPESVLGTVDFDSGRLGHVFGEVDGFAMGNEGKKIVMFGSDGSFLEGNDAESARLSVSKKADEILIFDDNNVTIAGHPIKYMGGFKLEKTLKGHGISTVVANFKKGENLSLLYSLIRDAILNPGPRAIVVKRKMAPGVKGIEGSPKGHDAISVDLAIGYFKERGNEKAVEMLTAASKHPKPEEKVYLGSSEEYGKCRTQFGSTVADIIKNLKVSEIEESLRVFDPDLEGSTGLITIRKKLESIDKAMAKRVYHNIGPMERAGILAAGGFGSEPGKQGIFSTFAAFIEMIISELTMLRMGRKNLLLHFSHIGEDDVSDNTCHFGWNAFYLDNGPAEEDGTRLYFGADCLQQDKIIRKVYGGPGIRAILSTRSAVPFIVDDSGKRIFGEGYEFRPGKDEEILSGKAGYVVAYGEMFYRALDAVHKARKDGIDVGIINKPTLNIVDEEMIRKIGATPFVLLVESQNYNTGMGVRFADWLAQRDLRTNYKHMGATKPGIGGQSEQIPYQGLAPEHILTRIKEVAR